MPKTDVFRVVFNDGKNRNALVFSEPVEGKEYRQNQMITFGDDGQSYFAPTNDEGVIPHRESDNNEELGITWHFAK